MADEEYRQFERDHVVGGYHSAEPIIGKRLRLGHDLTEICHDILRANLRADYNIDGIVKEILQFRAEANHPHMKQLSEWVDFQTDGYALLCLNERVGYLPPRSFRLFGNDLAGVNAFSVHCAQFKSDPKAEEHPAEFQYGPLTFTLEVTFYDEERVPDEIILFGNQILGSEPEIDFTVLTGEITATTGEWTMKPQEILKAVLLPRE